MIFLDDDDTDRPLTAGERLMGWYVAGLVLIETGIALAGSIGGW